MGEKLKPKRNPEENEARQAARAAKRERAKDARTVAVIAAIFSLEEAIRKIEPHDHEELVTAAREFLRAAQ